MLPDRPTAPSIIRSNPHRLGESADSKSGRRDSVLVFRPMMRILIESGSTRFPPSFGGADLMKRSLLLAVPLVCGLTAAASAQTNSLFGNSGALSNTSSNRGATGTTGRSGGGGEIRPVHGRCFVLAPGSRFDTRNRTSSACSRGWWPDSRKLRRIGRFSVVWWSPPMMRERSLCAARWKIPSQLGSSRMLCDWSRGSEGFATNSRSRGPLPPRLRRGSDAAGGSCTGLTVCRCAACGDRLCATTPFLQVFGD